MTSSNVVERIHQLKKAKNVMIVAHHYSPAEVHPVADVLSDSRGFFEGISGKLEAEVVMIIAPTFFAEIAAAMLPKKTVLIPVLSECPVAHHRHLSFDAVSEFKEAHPGVPLVCYATSPLRTKLLADAVAFPGEVIQTIEAVDSPDVLFVGEKNCSDDAVRRCRNRVIPFPRQPTCNVYDAANRKDVERLKSQYPEACVMVHPECKPEVIDLADHAIGTGQMRHLIESDRSRRAYILGTELGFFERMKAEFPDKTFVHLSKYLACNVFKVFRIESVLAGLEKDQHVVRVDRAVAERISVLVKRLLEAPPVRN